MDSQITQSHLVNTFLKSLTSENYALVIITVLFTIIVNTAINSYIV